MKYLLLMAIFMTTTANAESVKAVTQWSNKCIGNKPSFEVDLYNVADYPIDISVCSEKTDGKWRCWQTINPVKPGKRTGDGSYRLCDATGKVQWKWRVAGDKSKSIKFDPE